MGGHGGRLLRRRTIEPARLSQCPWSSLGEVYRALNRPEDAIAAYRRAVKLAPKLAWPYHHLGELDAERQLVGPARFVATSERLSDVARESPFEIGAAQLEGELRRAHGTTAIQATLEAESLQAFGQSTSLRGPVRVDHALHGAADVGDEPLMLSAHVPVVVARDRADGVALAKAQGATVILMDDGFQNPAVAKDASLIVIDSVKGIGNGKVMPAGPLRAPLIDQIARTDALLVIGEGSAADDVAARVGAAGKPVFYAHFVAGEASLAALRGKQVLAFAGIGDPERFFRTLRSNGVDVAATKIFPDHHPLSPREIVELQFEARRHALTLVTTEKDIARLRGAAGLPDWAQAIVPFAVTLACDDAAALRTFVTGVLFRARERRLAR